MEDLDTLYKKVLDFSLTLRNVNEFDDKLYVEIYQQLMMLFAQWEMQDSIPKSAFVSCVYLVDILATGSRFWSDSICVKVEDAHAAIQGLIANIDNHPPYPL